MKTQTSTTTSSSDTAIRFNDVQLHITVDPTHPDGTLVSVQNYSDMTPSEPFSRVLDDNSSNSDVLNAVKTLINEIPDREFVDLRAEFIAYIDEKGLVSN